MQILPGAALLLAVSTVLSGSSSQQPAADGQTRHPLAAPSTARIVGGCGLAPDERGVLVGIGHDYKAEFGAGLAYTPVLGKRAPRDMTWRWDFTSFGRSSLQPVQPVAPAAAGLLVRYQHGDVAEVWEVRSDGVKQSFVFGKLPPGQGDLVVRGKVATELAATAPTAAGITFELAGVGGVRIGEVVGIDASGAQVRGELRMHGDELEFRLPAAFVDRAALPLVLDPLVGTVVTLGGGNDDLYPDLAWDVTNSTWLAVWQRDLSTTNSDIRGQRLDSAGALVGGQINIETGATTVARNPEVASINARDGFVVIWNTSGDIFARGVLAADATMTAQATVIQTAGSQINADIGGEANATDDEAFIVWEDASAGAVILRPITFGAANTLTLGTAMIVSNNGGDAYPHISKSGGSPGFWLVTWHRTVGSQTNIHGRIWNRTLGFVTTAFAIESTATECLIPDNDGDGYNWVVAYARREGSSSDFDVVANSVRMHPGGVTVGPQIAIEADPVDSEVDPTVAWTGNSALVAFADEVSGSDYDAYVASVDPFRCTLCEGLFALAIGATQQNFLAVASKFAGGAFTSSDASLAWNDFDTGTLTGDIGWVRFQAADGSATDLGGACGNGGLAYATCGRSPNSGFQLRLRRAATSAAGICILGFQTLGYACGPCTLVADPYSGLITTVATDAVGEAVQLLPVPAGVAGNSILLQWLVAGNQCFASFDMSNAVRISLQ